MKKIIVAITGGIAAYKTMDIITGLINNGFHVDVITTDKSLDFITPTTIGAISKGNYITDDDPNKIKHIDLAKNCDAFVCVPCTANTLAKFTHGIADNFVTSTYLALPENTPKIICPAMNTKMWDNYVTQNNLDLLRVKNYIIQPVKGLLACGDYGIGKLNKPRLIVEEIIEILNNEPIWNFPLQQMTILGKTNDSYSYLHIDLNNEVEIPVNPHVGSFGIKRRYDRHRGIDLYAPEGTIVSSVEDGIVKDIRPWTGKNANCDWWLDTDAIAIEGKSGLVVYGEIEVDENIKLDDKILKGQHLGKVKRVLRNDKGRPTSMLHMELRDYGFYRNIAKNWDSDVPKGIKDPTPYLLRILKNKKL